MSQICRNCGNRVEGNYCSACGQRTSTHRLSWRSLVESFVSTFIGDEAYGLRGVNMRQGILLTWLSIIIRPARTISEFIAGARRKYFNPVAILLLLSTLYGVTFLLVGKTITPSNFSDGMLFNRFGDNLLHGISQFVDYARMHPAVTLLVMLPFSALALKLLLYRRCDMRYIELFYVGIFLSVFDLSLMVLQLPLELLMPDYNFFLLNMVLVFVYETIAYKYLFPLSWWGSVWRTAMIGILQYVFAFVAAVGLFILLLGGVKWIAPEQLRPSELTSDQADSVRMVVDEVLRRSDLPAGEADSLRLKVDRALREAAGDRE